MADNISNTTDEATVASIITDAPHILNDKFYPTIAPINNVKEKSLDFSFGDMSYTFTHLQKHGDSKHATLTITYTNNLMFNGQILGSSYTLPSSTDLQRNTTAPYNTLSNWSKDYLAAYYCTYGNAYIKNIHSFIEADTYQSAIGFVSHSYTSTNGSSYAYIIDFKHGVLQASIFDLTHWNFTSHSPFVFGGDRLKWDSQVNKYVINQFDVTNADRDYTDPIPTATGTKDGLMSKSSYSYVFSETGKLRTDVDALKKVTQAPCAYYVDFDNSPLFYRSASTGLKTTTYAHNNFWDQLLNVTDALRNGLQIIGYSNNPKSGSVASYTYINVSSAYFGCLCNTIAGDNSYFINTQYTYNSRIYSSYIYMASTFYKHSTNNKLSYLMMAYVSPLNMQEITSSNEGTFTK